MNAVGRLWRYLSSLTRRPSDEGTDARTAVRDAITRTQQERAKAATRSGGAVVSQAEIERALRHQHLTLSGARDQIHQAMTAAEHAAAGACADGGAAAAAPYERAVEGLRTQLDVVQTAISQLEELRHDARESVHRVRELLQQTGACLDGALRAEVSLLGRLDRLERERAIATAMMRAHQQRLPDR